MWKDLADLYRQSWRYALACPILFLVPVAIEAAQHVVEFGQGFYIDIAHARLVEHSPLRMAFGTAKVISLLFETYWVMRWLEWRDPARTAGLDRCSLATFLPLILFELVLALPQIWLPVANPRFAALPLWMILPSLVIGLLIADWRRTAPIGATGNPLTSAKLCAPVFFWALGFDLLAVLPPMVVHYALGFGAMKATGAAQLVMLTADTVFVGYLGAVIAGVSWYISERARRSVRGDGRRHDVLG